jgi:hypothetical protein
MPELSQLRLPVDLRPVRRAIASAACAAVLALSPAAYAAGDVRAVGGLKIYLGIVPAAIVQGHHPPAHLQSKMHGGVPRGRDRHHVMVAVFDAATGARIDDAVLTATVGVPGLAPVRRRLEPMAIVGAMSYGNYFALSSPGPYRIELHIVRPDADRPTVATFTYAPAR